ncbi:MAG: M23 family metallopeptidase [Georgenia sp.]
MSGSAVPVSAPHLTRRQIREAERAAQTARIAWAAEALEADQAVEVDPVEVEPREVEPRDVEDTEILPYRTPEPLPARRELRTRYTGRGTAPAVRHWAPRVAVLGALGAMTIVAPLTGLAGGDGISPAQADVRIQPGILALLDAQAGEAVLDTTPDTLLADPGAASRATMTMQASRAGARDALACVADGANGARAAVGPERQEQITRPIEDGKYRISSRYGFRVGPFTGYSKHLGTDFAAPLGTPIHAVADGTVEYVGVGKDGRSSMLIILRHEIDGETVYSWYNHMFPNGLLVKEGETVRVGDVIAEVGNNGRSTGPHVHLEIHLDDQGTTTDSLAWLEEHGAIDVTALC